MSTLLPGRAELRALLRDCFRLPSRWWWLAVAAFGLPATVWATAAALGGARTPSWSLVGSCLADLVVAALLVNLAEELAWTGFVQRRCAARWGPTSGSLLTAVLFAGVHLPLAVVGAHGAGGVGSHVLTVVGVAIGLRLLIGRLDAWSGRSLVTVALLHSSFNATEPLLEPAYDWVRVAVPVAVAVAVVAFGPLPASGSASPRRGR